MSLDIDPPRRPDGSTRTSASTSAASRARSSGARTSRPPASINRLVCRSSRLKRDRLLVRDAIGGGGCARSSSRVHIGARTRPPRPVTSSQGASSASQSIRPDHSSSRRAHSWNGVPGSPRSSGRPAAPARAAPRGPPSSMRHDTPSTTRWCATSRSSAFDRPAAIARGRRQGAALAPDRTTTAPRRSACASARCRAAASSIGRSRARNE